MIAPFWDDLRTDRAGGIVSNPGVYVDKYSEHMVITWEATRYGASQDSIKFQAIIYRNGDVRFNLDNATNFANFSPTLGISKGDNTNYIDVTGERATQKSWLFTLRKYVDPPPTHGPWGKEESYVGGTLFTLKNGGPETIHVVAIWVNTEDLHRRYDADIFISSGETISFLRQDIILPSGSCTVKVISERGNTAVYSKG